SDIPLSASGPVIEAHRGDSTSAPENTLSAFRRARDMQASWIELDVQQTRDHEIVVMHDPTVDRTTDGEGAIEVLSLADLKGLDAGAWFGDCFIGEPVPTLAEVADVVSGSSTRLNVEVKAAGFEPSEADRIVAILRESGILESCVISSFSIAALLAVRGVDPSICLALIGDGEDILAGALEHGFPWIHAQFKTVDQGLVQRAHAAGIKVNTWTMDDPSQYVHYRELGLQKLCTNRPGDLLAAAAAVGCSGK
ncbi:MAG: hypothetical protein HON70_06460, partial [Lentisphaerae bacterium]|nr:hypothetical protein [Lentisphaerota bacterium]